MSHKPNRLLFESSPYLQQHANNPVDWYPWGEEALDRAKLEQRPIFLSIGYSACHWCHVMERESFEDPETARLMNELFINIKVDREERPDLDHIYMSAVQMMTQHGGWPMSVFLTPDLKPFYGGTYFPPDDRMGMPSFRKILNGVSNAWKTRRDEILKTAEQLSTALADLGQMEALDPQTSISLALVDNAVEKSTHHFDTQYGGFGNAPKFFHTMELRLDLRHSQRTGDAKSLAMFSLTLDHLSRGGIYDHLGGGFHRYSTDRVWLVPHFEKMLYDNALLVEAYLEGYQATKKEDWARVARETLNYVLREMTSPEGGFYSTQDADTEGVEGKFYVWSKEEIDDLLDSEVAKIFCRVYGVAEDGNWEHTNILHLTDSLDEWATRLKMERAELEDMLAVAKRKMFQARSTRVAPFRDEKVLTSWNGLMIHAMALGAQVFEDARYLDAARAAARFIMKSMKREGDRFRLFHTYKDGAAKVNGMLDDYAALMNALITLFETDFDPEWLKSALTVGEAILEQFWEQKESGFYFTPKDHEALINRPREVHDGATPSASALAITALARLGLITGKTRYLQRAESALKAMKQQLELLPTASGQSLIALELLLASPEEWLVGWKGEEPPEEIWREIRHSFRPGRVLVGWNVGNEKELKKQTELLEGRTLEDDAVLYICRNMTCDKPVSGADKILKHLKK